MTAITDEHRDDWCAVQFLMQYRTDEACGKPRPLAEYLRMFPADPDLIAREFLLARAVDADDPALDVETRQTFGSYRFLRELGRGGQGVVYRARDLRLDRDVALKILAITNCDEKAVLRLSREALTTSKLEHPGICRIYDAGRIDGRPFLAMQLLDGGTLAERIHALRRDGALMPIDEALTLIERVARALDAAHEAGVTHRDIKPANIAFAGDGAPVVLDFGLARDTQSSLPTVTHGDLCGTPAYMAPEQLASEPVPIDRQCDIWALGVVLFELLTLQRPFDAPTQEGLCSAIRRAAPPDLRRNRPDAPRALTAVLHTALMADTSRRYRTAADFADDLLRVREGRPIAARRPSRMAIAWQWSRRNRALAASIAGVAVLLVAGLVSTSVFLSREVELRDRAEHRTTQIRRAANEMLFELDTMLCDLPGATEPRRLVLERARSWLDELAAEADGDPELVSNLTASYVRLGDVLGHNGTSNLGDTEGAIACYRRAIELATTNRERVDVHGTRRDLMVAHSRLGELLSSVNRLDEAQESLEHSLRLAEALVTDSYDTELEMMRAIIMIHLAQLDEIRGNPAAALAGAEQACAAMQRAAEHSDAGLDAQLHLAGARTVVGMLLLKVGSREEAYETLSDTARDLEELSSRHPHNDLLWSRTAAAWIECGVSCATIDLPRALGALDRGVHWQRRRHERDPADVTAARQYALGLVTRAEHCVALDAAAAEQDLATALAKVEELLDRHPGHHMARLLWIRTMVDLGLLERDRRDVESGAARLALALEHAERIAAAEPQNALNVQLRDYCRSLVNGHVLSEKSADAVRPREPGVGRRR